MLKFLERGWLFLCLQAQHVCSRVAGRQATGLEREKMKVSDELPKKYFITVGITISYSDLNKSTDPVI